MQIKNKILLSLLLGMASVCFGQTTATESQYEAGHQSIVDLAYNLSPGSNSSSFVKLSLINSHRFNRNFSLGLGTGFKYAWHGRYVSIPFFADVRYNFNGRNIRPYSALDVGYSFDASDRMKGVGVLFNPQVGVSYKVSSNSSLNFGVGYELQRTAVRYYAPDPPNSDLLWTRNQNVHSFTINLGFTF